MTPPFEFNRAEVRQIFASGKSQWRGYMNNWTRSIQLKGPVLDLGSGRMGTASYQRYIPNYARLWEAGEVLSVDIDPDRQPSKVADLNLGIPYADGEFQTCLAMGVFNYFYDFDTVTAEVVRILRPGGSFYAAIPFLDRVTSDHGDSVRLTAHALDKMLRGAGLKPDYILPCGSGGWGTALDMVEFMLPTPPLRSLAFRAAIALDGFATRRSGGKYRNAKDYPLGYLLLAHKA